jgi:hypothetical protein
VAHNETIGVIERIRRSGTEGQRARQTSSAAAPASVHDAAWRRWPPALPCGYEVVSSEQPAPIPFRKFSS